MRGAEPRTLGKPDARVVRAPRSSPPLRGVLVVDDHPAVREELKLLLGSDPDLAPVTSAATASEAVVSARLLRPAVAIVDYRLPSRDGVSLTFELKRLPEPPGVLIYSAFAGAELILAAVVAGADGLLDKASGAEELGAAVRAVAAHSSVMPSLSAAALDRLVFRMDGEDAPVVEMLVDGVCMDEVADRMGIPVEWLALRRWAIVQRLVRSQRVSTRRGRDL
jgi:DNA-binding NarL/FixJ family response regulator